jgi:hypothetical protein
MSENARQPFTFEEIVNLTDELCRLRFATHGISNTGEKFELNLTSEEKELILKVDQLIMNKLR